MFGWKKKREEKTQAEFHAICDGRVLPISQVPDITFAQKLLGDGVGFSYEEPVIYSPCDGEIILVAQTNHAIGLRAENGAEIMIHVGMDTNYAHDFDERGGIRLKYCEAGWGSYKRSCLLYTSPSPRDM